ncbi:glycoside hydrolase family 16 protein [Athelia psychrophila]|uniref:Glycoside hydrolase family 16 protein n=1 Tax=Athelia psychrophila TaxID=1759441 RepID=A0A166CRB4_9AGAM|nr:glycoside hydrolase family 16 protein [Fibularhizoctonia sp. CBS 109695]
MHTLPLLFLGSFPLAALAGNGFADSHFGGHTRHHDSNSRRAPSNATGTNTTYQLIDKYQGDSFLDGWDFFDGADPSHGSVKYLDEKSAKAKGLAITTLLNSTQLSVDSTSILSVGGVRNSVRIGSKKTYNGGLFIADFYGMPSGCGVWWSAGPGWPEGGEIDIIEGVNNQTNNQMTLHTGSEGGACTLNGNLSSTISGLRAFTSNVMGTQCESTEDANAGCAFSDPDPLSFGSGFTKGQGGVFAHLWDSTGIKMWRFARNAIPADITSGQPNPASWPTPQAAWSSASCDMASNFYNHTLTLDTTICGDWAGGAYSNSGCPGTCEEAVADPTNFASAKWDIHYIAVYQ